MLNPNRGLNNVSQIPAELSALRVRAHSGDKEAQFQWGVEYHTGKNIPQDLNKAAHWYLQSANQEHRSAQFNLGFLYQNLNLPQYLPSAIYWYKKAAANGSTRAQKALEQLDEVEKPKQENPAVAPVANANNNNNKVTEPKKTLVRPPVIPYKALTIGKKLGEGAFGVVYQAKRGLEDVVVKQLKLQPNQGLSPEALVDFENEAGVLEKLRSQFIIAIRGICTQPYCMVLEFASGGSLDDLLRKNTSLDWGKKLTIASDIGKGLAFLHSQDPIILHRDLKSENILLDENGRAKLGDFGLAKLKYKTQVTTGAAGTITHIAPELFTARPHHSEASDVYAYGIVLCEIATRQKPFAGIHPYDIAPKVLQGVRPVFEPEKTNPRTAPEYAVLVVHAWSQKAESRPKITEIVQGIEEQKKKLGK